MSSVVKNSLVENQWRRSRETAMQLLKGRVFQAKGRPSVKEISQWFGRTGSLDGVTAKVRVVRGWTTQGHRDCRKRFRI